jgi:hypothetical protein
MAPPSPQSETPEELMNIKFTRVVWVALHNALSITIKVYDITSEVLDKPDMFKEAKTISKSLGKRPLTYSLKQKGWWKDYELIDGDSSDAKSTLPVIANWKPSFYDMMDQKFSFPPESTHSDHDITLKRIKMTTRMETFIKDSIEYFWRFDKVLVRSKLSLIKRVGQEEKVVARFDGPFPTFRICGALAVDEEEVDFIVAMLTCCGMLRKDRQRR